MREEASGESAAVLQAYRFLSKRRLRSDVK